MIETTTISSKGQVTIPAGFREKLGLKKGTKVAFVEDENGRVYVMNATLFYLKQIQESLKGFAEEAGFKTEEDAMAFAISVRKGK